MNPRVVKEITLLQKYFEHIYVIVGSFNPEYRKHNTNTFENNVSIIDVQFGPLQRRRILYYYQSIKKRFARSMVSIGLGPRSMSEVGHGEAVPLLARAAAMIAADLYVAHYVAALPAAAWAAKQHGALYAFDAEDFHLGGLPDAPEHALEKRIIRTIEGRYLPGAASVTAASPMIAEAYAETYGIPLPTPILNVFPLRNAPTAPTEKGTADPGPSLYWFSQTIGPGRGLETALEAIARAKSRPHLYLRGTPARGYVTELQALSGRAGVADRLHLLDPAPPDELERLGTAYDLGYSGETGFSTNNTKALGNKIFSYLLGGVPSLASDIPSHRRLAPDLGSAMMLFPTDDAVALAVAIDGFLLEPARLAAARAHAWRLGQERYNWEAEAPRLVAQFSAKRLITCDTI